MPGVMVMQKKDRGHVLSVCADLLLWLLLLLMSSVLMGTRDLIHCVIETSCLGCVFRLQTLTRVGLWDLRGLYLAG